MVTSLAKVDIFKMTANTVGDYPVSGVDDSTKIARLLRDSYTTIRDAELRKHYWNFSIKRVNLAADTATPDFGFLYQYQLPSDAIAIMPPTVGGKPEAASIPYKLEGQKILTDQPAPLLLRYVFRQETEGYFDPLFVKALVAQLALTIGHNITGKASYVDRANAMYEQALSAATLNDAIESPHLYPEPMEVITERYT